MGGGGDLEMIRPNGTEWDGRYHVCVVRWQIYNSAMLDSFVFHLLIASSGRRDFFYRVPKLQALVYDILPLKEGAGKRCSDCVEYYYSETTTLHCSTLFCHSII